MTYVQKPKIEKLYEHDLGAAGPLMAEREKELSARLAKTATLRTVRQHENHYHYTLDNTGLGHTQWGFVLGDSADMRNTEVLSAACRSVIRRFAAYLQSDIAAAGELGCSLGIGVDLHSEIATWSDQPRADDVAFDVKLPVLEGISAETLLKLRQDEGDAFQAFREALRTTIQERINTAGKDSTAIAREIELDVIEPAVREIARRLRTAKQGLAKKSALRLALGALSTGVGLIVGIPILAAAGATSVLGTMAAVDSFADAQSQIKLSDMYFAWRASNL